MTLLVPCDSYQAQGEKFLETPLLSPGFAGLSTITDAVESLIPGDVMGSFHLGVAWVHFGFVLCQSRLAKWLQALFFCYRRKAAGFTRPTGVLDKVN